MSMGNTRRQGATANRQLRSMAARGLIVGLIVAVGFAAVSAQLVRLAMKNQLELRASPAILYREFHSRPDIVDRNGRLLATDVSIPSLFANPSQLASVDETLEQLSKVLPGIDSPKSRRALGDRTRKYYVLRRAVAPAQAQYIHDLGLPGIDFKWELKRSYPEGRLAGHVLGYVNGMNHGKAGIERFLNGGEGVERVHSVSVNRAPPLRLSIDVAAQYGLVQELSAAREQYDAEAATGVVVDAQTGEIAAAASVPNVDPSVSSEVLEKARMNRFADDVYELGSVFKVVTIAMAIETGVASPEAKIDVSDPLELGRLRIEKGRHGKQQLTMTEVVTHSSNLGAGVLAHVIGGERQKAFLKRLGLTSRLDTPDVKAAAPLLPRHWGETETITIGYGHGIAVAPLHFAVAVAPLVNGGRRIVPTYLQRDDGPIAQGDKVVRSSTSTAIRAMLRANVLHGTGRRADVPGYKVGGKTGTADIARRGGYDGKSVISSFFAAFPIDRPRYIVLISVFDPKPAGGKDMRSAARTAAPTAGRVIRRLAPILGVRPDTSDAGSG